jgi:hypothetical protein
MLPKSAYRRRCRFARGVVLVALPSPTDALPANPRRVGGKSTVLPLRSRFSIIAGVLLAAGKLATTRRGAVEDKLIADWLVSKRLRPGLTPSHE